MASFEETSIYKSLHKYYEEQTKDSLVELLAKFHDKYDKLISKNEIQDELLKELRELYIKFNEEGIDENIVKEKVELFLQSINDDIENINDDIENISSQLDTKAEESSLKTLETRMDTFTKLSEGSTTGDAELIDGRVGEDGVVYENIGSAIRTQFKKVSQILTIEDIEFTVDGYYIDKDGNVNPLDNWKTSDYIAVNKGDIVQITATGYSSNVAGVYFYDKLQNKIGVLQLLNDSNQTYSIIVPSTGYIRCSGRNYTNDVLVASLYKLNSEIVKYMENYDNNYSFNIQINTWTSGSFVNYSNGSLQTFDGYSYTDYIDISGLSGMYMYVTEYYQYFGGIAFYDENKNFIGGIHCESGSNNANDNLGQIVEIQLKGSYMRLTCTTPNIRDYKLYTSLKLISKAINYFSTKELSASNKVDLQDNFIWISGGYIKYDTGNLETYSGYSYTDYIDISNITNATVEITEYYDYASGIAFYDDNKKFISGIRCDSGGVNNNLGQIIEVNLKGSYMRITCKTSNIGNFKFSLTLSDLIFRKTEEEINPCFYKDNLNLIKMFNKVVCIGDSYTEGVIEYKNSSGTWLQGVEKNYSYPTQLSKIANIETVNLGHAGYTTTQWYANYENTDLSGYDGAIIFLGINDWYNNNETLDTNAYTNIINKLRTDNKNIPIFCVTITQNYSSSACNLNDTIREVATNNNCYIIDLGQYSDWGTSSDWLNGSHPNAYGYLHNAEMINSYINYIMENNKSDFYNLSFVGTDKIDI